MLGGVYLLTDGVSNQTPSESDRIIESVARDGFVIPTEAAVGLSCMACATQ